MRALNPLAKVIAVLPAIVWVLVSESVAVFVGCGVVAGLVVLTAGVWSPWRLLLGALAIAVAVVVLSLLFSVWTVPSASQLGVPSDSVILYHGFLGPVTLSAVLTSSETALRIAGIALLSIVSGTGSSRTGFTEALMQNARLPYRVGYTAYAASGYIPRLGHQWRTIKAAQRVRGGRVRRGPVVALVSVGDGAVALLIDALRHSERMALALESRSFGAYPTRTWRRVMLWRRRDTFFAATAIALTGCAIAANAIA